MKKVRLVGLLGVIAAAVFGWWLLRPADVHEPLGGARDPSRATAPLQRTSALLSAPLPEPRGSRVIRGTVLGPDGPVEGAVVVASTDHGDEVLSDMPCHCREGCENTLLECGCEGAANEFVELVLERRGEAPPIARAATAADGRFTLSGLAEGSYALWAEKPGMFIGVRRGVSAGDESADVEVTEGMTLRGKTVGDDGKPLSAAVTAIYDEHSRFFDATTGEDGTFAIGPVPEGSFSLVASAAGFLPAHDSASPSQPEIKKLQLFSARRLAGTVTRDGAPVRTAVALEGGHRKLQAQTDERGRFEFSGLKPMRYDLLAVDGPAQARASLELKPGKDLLDAQLRLSPGGTVAGSVRTVSGRPVARAEISVSRQNVSTRSGPDGVYRLGPLAPGEYWVNAEGEGYLAAPAKRVEVVEAATATLEFTLEEASPLSGIVVDEAGQPVEDASIYASNRERAEVAGREKGDEMTEREEVSQGGDSSGGDGRFSVDGLKPGRYEVTVHHDAYRGVRVRVTVPNTEVHITLSRGLELTGVLVDEEDRPVAGAQVTASPVDADSDEPSKTAEATGARGTFRMRGLGAGAYEVEARERGPTRFRRASATVEMRPGGSSAVRLKFEKGLTLEGTVEDSAGRPVPEAVVRAFPDFDAGRVPAPDAAAHGGYAVAQADGTFVIGQLKPGPYKVIARSEDAGSIDEPLKVNAGDSGLRIVLVGGGKVSGRVVQASGEPITRFKINLRDYQHEEGVFELPIKEPGEHRLVFQAEGYSDVARTYRAKPGEDIRLGEIVLSGGRPVSGRVVDAQTGDPIAGALVDVGDPELEQKADELHLAVEAGAVKTRADGSFTLPHVDAHPHIIVASHASYLLTIQPLPVVESVVTLRMERGAAVVGLVSDASGRPLPNARVVAASALGTHTATTGKDGRYRLAPVPKGSLVVAAMSRAANLPSRTVEVPASGDVQANFQEPSGGVEIRLVIPAALYPMLLPGDIPLPSDEDDLRRSALSAVRAMPAEEMFTFGAKNVVPGQYTLLLLDVAGRTKLRLARQVVSIPADPPHQTIKVPPPAVFTEIGVRN